VLHAFLGVIFVLFGFVIWYAFESVLWIKACLKKLFSACLIVNISFVCVVRVMVFSSYPLYDVYHIGMSVSNKSVSWVVACLN